MRCKPVSSPLHQFLPEISSSDVLWWRFVKWKHKPYKPFPSQIAIDHGVLWQQFKKLAKTSVISICNKKDKGREDAGKRKQEKKWCPIGLECWLRSQEHLFLLQRTLVWFKVPTWHFTTICHYPFWYPQALGTHVVYIHTHKQNIHA